MYYSAGPQYCYSLLYTVAKKHFTRPAAQLEVADFQRAYQSWIADVLPALPAPQQLGVELTNDDGCLAESLAAFRQRDPEFWEVFDIVSNVIVCTDAKDTPDVTSAAALGVIYVVRPRELTTDSLYELLVQESTHLMLFVDEHRSRHYHDDAPIAAQDNVLHSIVIATEVLLHREYILGHDVDSTIHPPTGKLLESTLRSAEATLDIQARRQLLTARGVKLVETCIKQLRELSTNAHAAPQLIAAGV